LPVDLYKAVNARSSHPIRRQYVYAVLSRLKERQQVRENGGKYFSTDIVVNA
jgi:hypothetical protein